MADIWGRNGGVYLGYGVDALEGPPNPSRHPIQYAGDRHVCLIGGNGSGKSRRIAWPNLLALRDWSMLVIDVKGELAKWTATERARTTRVVYLNPFKVGGLPSTGYNPLASLDPGNDDFVDEAMALAEAMIRIEGNDPHWPASAQDLVCACLMFSRLVNGTGATLRHVREIITQPSLEFATAVENMRKVGIEKDWDELAFKAGRFMDINPQNRELNSILSSANTQTRWLDSRAIKDDTDKGDVDFERMKHVPMTVYLILPANRLVSQSSWLRLILTSVLRRLMRDATPGNVPVLLCLEEFAALGRLQVVEDYQALMRGYGLKLLYVLQDLTQLQTLYKERWESFLANAGVLQSFAPQDLTTARYLSERSGQAPRHISSYSATISRTTGRPEQENLAVAPTPMPVLLPQELMSMDQGYSVVFSHKAKGVVRSYAPDPEGG